MLVMDPKIGSVWQMFRTDRHIRHRIAELEIQMGGYF